MSRRYAFFFGAWLASVSFGASLPGNLSTADVHRVTQVLAMGGATRLLRSAEAYPSYPGFKVGLEVTFLPSDSLTLLGDANGSIPWALPVPRIYIAKGLIQGLELIGSFFPAVLNTVTGLGGVLKWSFLTEKDWWAAVAGFAGVTGIIAFQTEFEGAVFEAGVVMSKDYVRFRPYAGAALQFARGRVASSLAAAEAQTGMLVGTHFFIGGEIETPINFTLQIDFTGVDPSLSVFIGKHF